jgi:hypothetical protein
MMYPLSEYDGRKKTKDWANLPRAPAPPSGEEETQWVHPEKFVDELPLVLADAAPLPGEEARYAQVLAVAAAARNNPAIKQAMTEGAREADEKLVKPLFQFRNYGQQLPHNWTTISNESAFGTDYYTRTAVAKSNILVNSPNETLLSGPRRGRRAAQQRQSLHRHLRRRAGSSGERLLVAVDLQ